jgi:Flp pilus assembly pilin Flp
MLPKHLYPTLITSEHGQTMTETAVLLALIVLVVMVAVQLFGTSLGAVWAHLSSTLPNG